MSTKSILVHNLILGSDAVPSSVKNKVGQQQTILAELKHLLPDALIGHVSGCHLGRARLTLFTGSPARASQLRFYCPQLQEQLNLRCGLNLLQVRIRIALDVPGVHSAGDRPALRPAHSRRNRLSTNDDPDPAIRLQKAVDRLETTLKKRRPDTKK